MNDMERRKFEEQFADAFRDAEVQPADKVWTNVELELEKADGKKMKRRILFYQMLAAASFAFAMAVAGLGYYSMSRNDHSGQLASSAKSVPDALKPENGEQNEARALTEEKKDREEGQIDRADENDRTDISSRPGDVRDRSVAQQDFHASNGGSTRTAIGTEHSISSAKSHNHNIASSETSSDIRKAERTLSPADITEDPRAGDAFGQSDEVRQLAVAGDAKLPALVSIQSPVLSFNKHEVTSEADPVALMFARLKDLEDELSGEQKSRKKKDAAPEKLWTSVGFAAGGFNSVNPSVSSESSPASFTAANTSVVNNQTRASGVAYSAGVSVGTRLSERWVFQGGLSYLSQLSNYTADVALGAPDFSNFKAASINEFSDGRVNSNSRVIPTAPYSVNSNVELLAIPMQAGYILVNRKVSFQLNAGVSTDLFLQNTINPEGNTFETTSQGPGGDSPYRSVNMSGLFGSEVSYRFSDRYRLTLNPGLRYPFSSIYKTDTGVEASPLIFDVGLRFRYIFR